MLPSQRPWQRARDAARQRDEELAPLARQQGQVVDGLAVVERGGRGVEANGRAALDAVEALVAEHHLAIADLGSRKRPRRAASHAADLEDVGEVGGEVEGQLGAHRRAAVVAQHEALVADALPQTASIAGGAASRAER